MKRILSAVLTLLLLGSLSACGTNPAESVNSETGAKKLVIGDTTWNPENEEHDLNPHNAYSGWACIRYGVGETLVRYSDDMELEPWLAERWENVDPLTWSITMRDGISFTSGRALDAEAVRQCLEHLLEVHDRAPSDLNIASMEADGQVLTVHTKTPNPGLLNDLGDPYSCIIDVDAGFDNGIVAGTGPYIAVDCQSGDHLTLVKNEHYWNGTPQLDELTIRTISDGNTLANALQSGEIQAAYGMAYENYPLFENENYTFSQIATSRCFFLHFNHKTGVCTDPAVRKAIAMGIDKQGFVETLLDGNGEAANGVFPAGSAFGGDRVTAEPYDPEGAKAVLEQAGWVDADGDGIREKDGQRLELKWLTYPSRQELPLLAEAAQSTLQAIGIAVDINSTPNCNSVVEDLNDWDVFAMANVNAPTGDPAYWFNTMAVSTASKNRGQYSNPKLDALAAELDAEFGPEKRAELAVQMQQLILDDDAYVFCAFLKMSQISRANVTGYDAHACDYYQVTADLDVH